MKNNDLLAYKNKFGAYTAKYFHENKSKNIKLKISHSYAVCKNMKQLGEAMNLSRDQVRIAGIIGLFHDIARFQQYEQYSTFRDDLSFNHATMGVEIIDRENFLSNEENRVKAIIKTAILHHNKEKIPVGSLDEEMLLYCKLIRDADKLDIYETLVNYHLKQKNNGATNSAIELNLPENGEIHPGAIQDIMDRKIVGSNHVKGIKDLVLLQMGWVFDINFAPSMQIIKDKKYIQKLADVLPDNRQVKQVTEKILNQIDYVTST